MAQDPDEYEEGLVGQESRNDEPNGVFSDEDLPAEHAPETPAAAAAASPKARPLPAPPAGGRGSSTTSAAASGGTNNPLRQRHNIVAPSSAAAARAAVPKGGGGGVPRAPVFQSSRAGGRTNYGAYLVGLAVVVFLCVGAALAVGMLKSAPAPKARQPIVYAMATRLPTTPCARVSSDDVLNGTAMHGYVNLRDMKATLEQHISDGGGGGAPLRGMCAQYLSVNKICMCIVDMSRDGDKPDYRTMYNIDIVGISPDDHVRNTEKSALCADPVEVLRFAEIGVEYLSEEGMMHERWVKGQAAQIIQQLNIVERGRGSCEDSNLEAQIKILTDTVTDMRARLNPLSHPDQMPTAGSLARGPRERVNRYALPNGRGHQKQNALGDGHDY